jgi:hypothetical protein
VQLLQTETQFLRQIQKSATNEYFFYATGKVSAEKTVEFCKKIRASYETDRSKQQKWRAKKKGVANTNFFLFPDNQEKEKFNWVIMATKGEGKVHENEKLSDLRLRKSRLRVMDYELVQKPRSDAQESGKTSFTFQLTRELREIAEKAIRETTRSGSVPQLMQLKRELEHFSSFSGVRAQRKAFEKLLKAEVTRKFGKNSDVFEAVKPNNFYFKTVKIEEVLNITTFIKAMIKNDRTALEQMRVYRSQQNFKH